MQRISEDPEPPVRASNVRHYRSRATSEILVFVMVPVGTSLVLLLLALFRF